MRLSNYQHLLLDWIGAVGLTLAMVSGLFLIAYWFLEFLL
jgi:hypothetical protein